MAAYLSLSALFTGGFRRLRDDFLEAIALAVLDQHEVETAEAELKRLNNEQEVRVLAVVWASCRAAVDPADVAGLFFSSRSWSCGTRWQSLSTPTMKWPPK